MSTTTTQQQPQQQPADPTELVPPAGRGRAGRFAAITGGASALPLGVLLGLNFVDQFDAVAFAALTPEIRDAFDLTDAGIGAIGVISTVFILLAALPIGYVADRSNRVRVAAFAAVLWSTMSILTGVVPTVLLLFAVRLLAGIGRIINEVVHPSLLGDYYKPEVHPRVFQIHRLANPVAAVSGIVAGAIGAALGWRAAFILLAIPTYFFLVLLLTKLREPKRGESIDAAMAARAEELEGKVPFAEARRQLYSVRTLRRLWVGAFFLGVGYLAINQLLSLFFEDVYGYGPFERGIVQFVFGAGTVAGLIVGGNIAARAAREGHTPRLATITGLSFVQFAVGLILMAIAPWALLSLAMAFVLSMGVGAYQPAYFSLVGLVAPPRVRSQAYAYAILFVGLGGFSSIPLFALGDAQGYRWAIAVLAVIVALAGLIGASASRFVRRDIEQARNTLSTAIRVREEFDRADGRRPLLVCKGVDVAYDQVQVLFGVDLEVYEGDIIALLGTNGAGKSTLLKAISGTVDPIGGAIFYDGRDITHADAVQTAKQGIIQVPGGRAVFPTLTVAEHFKAGTWLYTREDPAEIDRRVEAVLERFPRLRERWDQMAGNLSGGEQQQLALGMAFVARPRLLIIDELSLGLAPTVVELLLDMVRAIHAQGCTVILVEQSVNVALTISDRAYFMEKGEVRFSGPTAELLERGDILRAVFLEGAGSVNGEDGGSGKAPAAARRALPEAGERAPILEVEGLTKRFGGITAVNDVSFTLAEGEILGLIGPNGAGKTTIFDLVSGHLPLDAGSIRFKGIDVTRWGPDRRAAIGLGRSFQDARIFPSLTVAENIALGLDRHIETRDHVAALLGLPAIQQSELDVAWTVDDLIELMHLGAFRNKFVSELSTGSRRVVDLAMAIAHDPDVLLLDEPSSGIAQRETEALGPLLKRIQREANCSLLIIEHDMPLITAVSDEIIALELGAVVTRGLPEEVLADERVVSAYLGGDLDIIHRSGESKAMASRSGPAGQAHGDGDGDGGGDGGGRRRRREPLRARGG
jgi:branched-chain amino acid transport system ATP-binding protein